MLNILCALNCEANPITRRYDLKKKSSCTPYPIFERDNIRLIISGIGKVSSAAAAAYLGALHNTETAWLNIGIAGHRQMKVGTSILAHKITDAATNQHFYPEIASYHDFRSDCMATLDQPINHYPEPCLYEMEASGFFQTAQRFSTVDQIQCFKVISDNEENPTQKINKPFVQELIHQSMDSIEKLINRMLSLKPESSILDTSSFQNHCHWTQTELHQLERLLVRWKAIGNEIPAYQHLTKPQTILSHLEKTLNQQPLCFTPSTLNKQ